MVFTQCQLFSHATELFSEGDIAVDVDPRGIPAWQPMGRPGEGAKTVLRYRAKPGPVSTEMGASRGAKERTEGSLTPSAD